MPTQPADQGLACPWCGEIHEDTALDYCIPQQLPNTFGECTREEDRCDFCSKDFSVMQIDENTVQVEKVE